MADKSGKLAKRKRIDGPRSPVQGPTATGGVRFRSFCHSVEKDQIRKIQVFRVMGAGKAKKRENKASPQTKVQRPISRSSAATVRAEGGQNLFTGHERRAFKRTAGFELYPGHGHRLFRQFNHPEAAIRLRRDLIRRARTEKFRRCQPAPVISLEYHSGDYPAPGGMRQGAGFRRSGKQLQPQAAAPQAHFPVPDGPGYSRCFFPSSLDQP